MNSWCVANCAMGVCPPDKCSCEDESAPIAAPVVDDAAVADTDTDADTAAVSDAGAEEDGYAAAAAAAAAASADAVAKATAATDAAIADNAAAAAAMGVVASGLGNIGLPIDENHNPPDRPRNLNDWFWEEEGKLLAKLPDDNSVDSQHRCYAA